jgi:hypothetical protein
LNDEDPIGTDDNRLLNLFKKQNKKKTTFSLPIKFEFPNEFHYWQMAIGK